MVLVGSLKALYQTLTVSQKVIVFGLVVGMLSLLLRLIAAVGAALSR